MRIFTRNHVIFVLLLAFLLAWGYVLSTYGAEEIVQSLGINDVYWAVLITSSIGGVSTLFAGSFYATIITFTLGGLDPIVLGLIAGVGASLGDSAFFYFGLKGRDVLAGRWRNRATRFSVWLQRQNDIVVAMVIFLYAGFTPFPKDLLVVALAMGNHPYRKMIPPLLLGNICLVTMISYFTLQGAFIFGDYV